MKGVWGDIWVYAQHHGREIDDSTLELLGKARKLADKATVDLSAILVGSDVEPVAHELISYGSDKVYLVEHEELKHYTTIPYARLLTELIKKERPRAFLFPADTTGRDLAPRIAARLETGLTADCVDLDIGNFEDNESGRKYENILLQVVPAFGGNVLATIVTPERRPQMATVRRGTFEVAKKDLTRRGEIITLEVDSEGGDNAVKILEVIGREDEVDFKGAKTIVSGGRGVGGTEGFELLREFAGILGAKVGASRGATDAGWVPPGQMIGLTGQIVKPKIYIACGISGAPHHTMGIKNSKTIIAVNKDPEAPIFDVADYGVVGDLFEVIPKLMERIKNQFAPMQSAREAKLYGAESMKRF